MTVEIHSSARLLAFESRLDDGEQNGYGACSDCATDDVALVIDPDPELQPDGYCVPCVRLRINKLRAFLLKGATR